MSVTNLRRLAAIALFLVRLTRGFSRGGSASHQPLVGCKPMLRPTRRSDRVSGIVFVLAKFPAASRQVLVRFNADPGIISLASVRRGG
ncbi:MAG: hypothetical protein DMF97_13170 [Acidobacteria bacterium]|nr:MAG: hypothetical protein DMF97_13170 [Acidobacteriota bacterium]